MNTAVRSALIKVTLPKPILVGGSLAPLPVNSRSPAAFLYRALSRNYLMSDRSQTSLSAGPLAGLWSLSCGIAVFLV